MSCAEVDSLFNNLCVWYNPGCYIQVLDSTVMVLEPSMVVPSLLLFHIACILLYNSSIYSCLVG